jgi:cardiolipin-specific phospholipase
MVKEKNQMEELDQAEKELIRLGEVPLESERIYMESAEGLSIFCLKFVQEGKPPLVLIHGYCGTSIIFYKLFKSLSENYSLYCLDLMGMGRSSRPEFTAKTREEAELFFVMPIEVCRVKLNIDKMTLVGHSFGGYIAGCYTEAFPQNVSQLVLMSSIGIPRPPGGDVKNWTKSLNWKFRTLVKLAKYLVGKGLTPPSILRKLGSCGKRFVRRYLKKRWRNVPDEDLEYLELYLYHVNNYPGSGEFALKELFVDGGFALKPLCERIVRTPTLFIYGDRDWMDPAGAAQNASCNECEVRTEIISRSGHHMYIDNPEELTQKMLDALSSMEILN